ncbi:unnamed protein product [marine sediment metagenome]|uniref:Uncharacterized protein n=1 Tax=marine sediment metagenome TaxID=412755 RepID=X0Z4J2_9ZZZZ
MKIPFPISGLSAGSPSVEQPLTTSFSLQNVRAFDVEAERIRGGQRAGTALAYDTQVVGSHPVIDITSIVTTYIVAETP